MKTQLIAAVTCAFAFAAGSVHAQSGVVTLYSADGLHDGTPSWFGNQFEAFTKATGIKVQYIEAGSSGVVDRLGKASFTGIDGNVTGGDISNPPR
ncbi:hypothetical protein [Paraburkholderia silvatlantica]|uniref:hypothetical protein n=1 Tax=Paraburkholderia silvatlantica TaxID=321895 RepID=UPI003750E392